MVRLHDGTIETFGPLNASERYPMFATGENLVDVILRRKNNGSPGVIGARVVQILDAAYRSARQDGVVISIDEL